MNNAIFKLIANYAVQRRAQAILHVGCIAHQLLQNGDNESIPVG
jgi:hypothetical protein